MEKRAVKCPKCQQVMHILSLPEDREIGCIKCKGILKVPGVKKRVIESVGWRIRVAEGKYAGPFSEAAIKQLISKKQVVATSELNHPKFTGSSWKKAKDLQQFHELFLEQNKQTIGDNCDKNFPVTSPPPIEATIRNEKQETTYFVSANATSRNHLDLVSQFSQDKIFRCVIFSIASAFLSGPFAIVFSQYYPIFGGVLNAIGEPWSPARRSGIPIHLITFGITFAVFGASVSILANKSKAAAIAIFIGAAGFLIVLIFWCAILVFRPGYQT